MAHTSMAVEDTANLDDVQLFFTIGGDAWIRAQSYIRRFNTGPI